MRFDRFGGWFQQEEPRWKQKYEMYEGEIQKQTGLTDKELQRIFEVLEEYGVLIPY